MRRQILRRSLVEGQEISRHQLEANLVSVLGGWASVGGGPATVCYNHHESAAEAVEPKVWENT